MALMQRRAEPGDAVKVGEVERHQGRAAAVLSDLVVELFETALRSRNRHHMRAGLGERARGRVADAARCAGHKGDAGGEGRGHPNNSISSRPRESEDPYAVTVMIGESALVYLYPTNEGLWLWVPAFAGTTRDVSSLPPTATIAAAAVRPGSGR